MPAQGWSWLATTLGEPQRATLQHWKCWQGRQFSL